MYLLVLHLREPCRSQEIVAFLLVHDFCIADVRSIHAVEQVYERRDGEYPHIHFAEKDAGLSLGLLSEVIWLLGVG